MTDDERAWIAAHPLVRIGVPRAFAPIAYRDREGRLAGVLASLLDMVARRTGLSFEPVFEAGLRRAGEAITRREAAMALVTFPVGDEPASAHLTLPFFRSRLALVARRSVDHGSASKVRPRRIAVIDALWQSPQSGSDRWATHDLAAMDSADPRPAAQREPQVMLTVTETPAALAAIAAGRADAALLYQPVARYVVFHRYRDDLHFVGAIGPRIAAYFLVGDEHAALCGIINKALRTIPPQTIESLASQWTYTLPVESGRGASTMPTAIVVAGVVLLATLIYNVRLWQRMRVRQHTARALRRRLAFLFRLVDANPHSIYFCDADGRLRECNRAFCEALGRRKSELVGRRLDDMHFFSEATRSTLARAEEQIRRGSDRYVEEVTVCLNGISRTGLHWAAPLHGKGAVASPPYAGVIGGWIDLTEQKRLQDALRVARDEARAADRAKTMFLATMSHEVRTPMNIVIGMLELIGRSADPEAVRHAELAREAATALLKLLNDILEVSRAECGEMPFDAQVGNLADTLRAATALFQTPARARGLALTFSADDALPAALRFDPSRIRQIAYNLVGNAIKFTDAGRVDVEVRLLRCTAEFCLIEMRVSDTGIGMDPATLRDVFEPFRQGGAGTYRRYGGSGMGLAICQRIVSAMQGRITLESETGTGTRAAVIVPMARPLPPSSPAPFPAAAAIPLPIGTAESNRQHVDAAGSARSAAAHEDRADGGDALPAAPGADVVQTASAPCAVDALADRPDDAEASDGFVQRPAPHQSLRTVGGNKSINRSEAAPPSHPTESNALPAVIHLAPGATVLAVDDHPANRVLLTTQLRRLGFNACAAESGEQALVVVASRSIDAVLTDCSMRGIDGFSLAVKIGALCDAPVIGYSADPSDACLARCLRAGMTGCLVKPVGLNELAACLGVSDERRDRDAPAGPLARVQVEPDGIAVAEVIGGDQAVSTKRRTHVVPSQAPGGFDGDPDGAGHCTDTGVGSGNAGAAPLSESETDARLFDHLLILANHEATTARALLSLFIEGLRQTRDTIASGDFAGMRQHAHRNKGPAAMLRMDDFVAACDALTACPGAEIAERALQTYLHAVEACERRLQPLQARLDALGVAPADAAADPQE
ncbi:ATP-binding protein [Chitinasiproducens palmae]|uniref:ATP-binding protein n=1 Tax=Chitinasiproducens palmae TaxID=1770053 RepID=UPI00147CFD3B|nr:ATP-binding protein [Chitinasiproducens palmae]